MIKKFKDLKEADLLVSSLYAKNPDLKNTKFGYSYKRFADKFYLPQLKKFRDDINILRIDFALEDKVTKEILRDANDKIRGFKYSKQGLKDLMKEEYLLVDNYDRMDVEIESFISPFVPEGLSEEETELLKGIVLI